VIITLTAKMAARLNTIVAIAMLALYDEFDTYWQNGGNKKISDIIFAEWHIFIVSNLCSDHSSPKMRVEIFTLARGARACIESTQFIIMTESVIHD
jgi:hypothetical protein